MGSWINVPHYKVLWKWIVPVDKITPCCACVLLHHFQSNFSGVRQDVTVFRRGINLNIADQTSPTEVASIGFELSLNIVGVLLLDYELVVWSFNGFVVELRSSVRTRIDIAMEWINVENCCHCDL